MLTDTAEYALRAVLFLARQEDGSRVSAAQVAEELDLPRNYLSKVLRRLAHQGVLESSRGPAGGFRLARPAGEVTLGAAIEPFYDFSVDEQCLLGRRKCSERDPCVAHAQWKSVVGGFRTFFNETTIHELIEAEESEAVE